MQARSISQLRNFFFRGRGGKLVSIFLLAFETFFLNVVLPGHTRGIITLSGRTGACSAADLGCPFCSRSADPKKAPTKQAQGDCAICHLALRITTNPPIDFGLDEFRLLGRIDPPAPQSPRVASVAYVHFSRGPPACAA